MAADGGKGNSAALARRRPRVVTEPLRMALRALAQVPGEEIAEQLARHRRNRARRIAAWGLSGVGAPVPGCEAIAAALADRIERLADAWDVLHDFDRGDTIADYLCDSVVRAVLVERADATDRRAEIAAFCAARGYPGRRGEVKRIVVAATAHFRCSERTIYAALKLLHPE